MSSMIKVAREANVAVSTVSLALNHRDRVKPETRERIEQAMRRLGYRPNLRKENAKKNEPLRVAFIYTLESLNAEFDGNMSSYCREVISGMQQSMSGSSSSLSIFRGADHVSRDVMVNEQINASEFDGLVLFGSDPKNGYLDRLQESGLPLVVMNRTPEHGRFSCVTLDYYGGARLAIDHLVSLGHRRIALGMSTRSDKWLAQELCHGARDAMASHGQTLVIDGTQWSDNIADEEIQAFCRKVASEKVTAVFASDYVVVRLAGELSRMGLRVPEDVSLIGFDDRGLETESKLPLTTIGYDKRRMGRMVIRLLQQLVGSRGKIRWLGAAVSTYLVKGQTVAKLESKQ